MQPESAVENDATQERAARTTDVERSYIEGRREIWGSGPLFNNPHLQSRDDAVRGHAE